MFIAHLPPAFAYVYNWVNEFKRGHISICDAPRSGFQLRLLHQKSSIKSTILFWLIDEWKCASLLRPDISHGTVISILHEKLSVKKLSARWVPRLLTVDRATVWRFQNNVWRCFKRNPDEFLRRFITVDETWIHYFTSEMKEQSKQ